VLQYRDGVRGRPEAAPLTANASVFQPSAARILGDMVSDYEASEPLNPGAEDTYPGVIGGRSILVAGADSAPTPGEVAPSVKGLPPRPQTLRGNRKETG
jgi:hypothetical protein